MGHHALVFGASGISGWGVTNALLEGYPSPDTFSKVTALTNRPLSPDVALWPKSDKLQLVSGIDLLTEKGQEGLDIELKSKIKDIETVSHVYFFSYIFDMDAKKEIDTNVMLLDRAITALEHLSTSLKFVVLPTGTKLYGVHLLSNFPFTNNLPLKEDHPRIPEPAASEMFYYNQVETLNSKSAGKSWTWCDVRPDIVVGYVPNNNVYSMAQHLVLYLSLYRAVEGAGAEVVFPGTEKSWKVLFSQTPQDVLAHFCIYASLHPEKAGGGQGFNVADNSKPSSWADKWPVICEFFGLKGVGPPAGGSGPQPGEYIAAHLEEWKKLEKENNLQSGRVGNDRSLSFYPYFIMTQFDFDRHMDLSKSHKVWSDKTEEVDQKQVWWTAFERYRKAKIVP